MKNILFEQAGLSKNEAEIYKLVLEHGEIVPPQIAELTGITRQNTYAILKSLVQKELVEEIDRKKKLTYRPLHPSALIEHVKRRRKEQELAEKTLEAAIPELAGIFNLSTNKPGVTYFEGIEGVKKIYENTLSEKPDEILVLRSPYDQGRLGPYLTGYVKRRARLGIKSKIILPKIMQKAADIEDQKYLRERKFIDKNIFNISTEIDIYNDQVAFISLDKKVMGFIISSKDVAQTFRNIFELIWDKY
jgi:sugar-specific transcriptional regulator TrmB